MALSGAEIRDLLERAASRAFIDSIVLCDPKGHQAHTLHAKLYEALLAWTVADKPRCPGQKMDREAAHGCHE